MKTIHKYVLEDVTNDVATYEGAKLLHVANQHEQITVWAEINTLERKCVRTLHVVGTGSDIPAEADAYVGSAVLADGRLVFHVYADREAGR